MPTTSDASSSTALQLLEFDFRLYSNQRTESVLLNDTVTSDSSPPTKTRKEALDRQRQVERNRRWLARKLEVDPGYRARLSQRKQA
jgi:membrane-anchored protein YejM (alkaline phosphatase superfamily)